MSGGIFLSFLAGSATAIGASSVWLIRDFKPLPFVAALSFAAGVMSYISFTELYPEAIKNLETGMSASNARIVTTLLFFFGWVLASGIDKMTHYFIFTRTDADPTMKKSSSTSPLRQAGESSLSALNIESSASLPAVEASVAPGVFQRLCLRNRSLNASEIDELKRAEEHFQKNYLRVFQLGLTTCIAIAVHNFPEGIATYSGASSSARLGLGIALAIGLHNIPEGFAVAIPIYFATKSRLKAFSYAVASGMAEPLGAIITSVAIGSAPPPLVLGCIFGVVCGIMLNVAIKDLYFEAVRLDPIDVVVNGSFLGGMMFMAISLVLIDNLNAGE